ncbi:MAG: hypothetical protein AAGF12_20235 [Myxococcota bacterium]
MADVVHRIYLVPGMFGFGKLAGYDYFEHVERSLGDRFDAAGIRYVLEVVPTPPTASIRRRARVLAGKVFETAGSGDDPIHLVGHSTGGLDARIIASPTTDLDYDPNRLRWTERLRSVVTMNTPHHGTPLAQFFTSVSGTRLLYALSLLTFTTLRYGGPSLTVLSSLVAAIGRIDEAIGVDIHLLDRTTDLLLRVVGTKSRSEVKGWLDGIQQDQGGIIQITPEAMDIFNASTVDANGVRYGCLATAAPSPSPLTLAKRVLSPYAALSATIYTTLYTITSREHAHYPCPTPDEAIGQRLAKACGVEVGESTSDGIVPTRSMLWGKLLWAGTGDHLDVVGHFKDDAKPARHIDWLHSGAGLTRRSFGQAMDALAHFILDGS